MKYIKKLGLLLVLLLIIVCMFVACKDSIPIVKVSFTVDGEVRHEYLIEQGYGLEEVPAVPERKGYIGSWNEDSFTEFYRDTTITAVYTKNFFTVTFKAGTLIMRRVDITIGDNVTSFPDIPPMEGYEAHWEITDFSTLTVDTIVNAIYTPIKLKLTFKSEDNEDIIRLVDYDSSLQEIPAVPLKEGFVGVWDITNFSNIKEDITINAIYSSRQITINYVDADDQTTDTEIVSYGELLPLPATQVREGYIFNGWYLDDGYKAKATHISLYDDINVYAQWVEINHHVATDLSLFSFALLDDDTYEISLVTTEDLPTEIILPNSYDGKLVTKIADRTFIERTELQSIVIPTGVTEIGDEAFARCINLGSVAFDTYNRLKKIGDYAFFENYSLNNVSIAEDIEVIGDYAFNECRLLYSFYLPTVNNLRRIGDYAFEKSNIRELNISEKIVYIGDFALSGLTSILNFYGLDNLEHVGRFAFENCSGLEYFNAPNIEYIGQGAFSGCKNLKELTILADIPIVDYFDESAFDNSYMVVQRSKNRDEYGEFVIDGDGNYDERLIEHYLPTGLRSIRIKTGVIDIVDYVLNNCVYVNNIYIPNTVRNIGLLAFAIEKDVNVDIGLGQLDIALDSQLETIEDKAFFGRVSFNSITFPKQLRSIGEEAFLRTALEFISVDSQNLAYIGKDAFLHSDWYDNQPSIVYLGNIAIGYKGGVREITLLEDTKAIAPYAFAHYVDIITIHIPSSVKIINEYAFADCEGLTRLTIDEGVETICDNAFEKCINLHTVKLPKSLQEIGKDIFSGCYSIKTMELYGDKVLGDFFGEQEYDNSYSATQKQLYYQDLTVQEDENSSDTFYINWKEIKNIYGKYPIAYNIIISNSIGLDGNIVAPFVLNTFTHEYFDSAYYQIIDGIYFYSLPIVRQEEPSIGFKYTSDPLSLGDYFYCGSDINIIDLITIEVIFESDYCIPYALTDIILIDDNTPITDRVIAPYAFMNISSLEKITFVEGIKEIGIEAFKNCSSLGFQDDMYINILLPSSLIKINQSAFEGTINLRKLGYASSVPQLTIIGDSAFKNSGLESFSVPASIRIIEEKAFYGSSKLSMINFENPTVEIDSQGKVINYLIIGEYAFANCERLNISIEFPDRLISIKSNAFSDNSMLGSISFGVDSKLSELGEQAFANCIMLDTIVLPRALDLDTVESPLWGCYNLTTITMYNNNVDNYHSTTLGMLFGGDSYGNDRSYPAEQNGVVYYLPNSLKEVIFGGGIIAQYTFQNAQELRRVNLTDVTLIADYAFENCRSIEEINLPDTVTEIGQYAFRGCTAMTNFNFTQDSQLASIGEYAFANNTALEQFITPDGITIIEDYTFYECNQLSSVELLNIIEIGDYAFYNCNLLNQLDLAENLSHIGKYAFYNCINAQVIYKKFNELRRIGESAFYNCLGLRYLDAERIETIEAMAFYGAYNLQELSIPSVELGHIFGQIYYENSYPVSAQGTNSYYIPVALERVKVSKEVLYLPDYAFRDCTQINEIIFLSQEPCQLGVAVFENTAPTLKILVPSLSIELYICSFGSYADRIYSHPSATEGFGFSLNNDDTYTLDCVDGYSGDLLYIPSYYNNKAVTQIGNNAVKNNNSILEIIIPNTVVSIGEAAFENCINLNRVSFEAGSNLISISHKAFYQCDSLASIVIPKSVKTVGSYAFGGRRVIMGNNEYEYISSLYEVVFDKGSMLETIGDYAFYLCKSLEYIVIPNSVQSIGKAVFRESGLKQVDLPLSIVNISEELFFGCANLQEITLSESITIIGKNAFSQCTFLTKIVFNDSIKQIGVRAFYNCSALVSLNITQDLERIESEAFMYCTALEEVLLLSETLYYIGDYAFSGCTNLYRVELENQNIVQIGEGAFSNTLWYQQNIGDDGVLYINNIAYSHIGEIPPETELVLRAGTISIASHAFAGQENIVKVTVPSSVVNIGDYAFYGCSNLQTFIFADNSQLEKIGGYAFYQTSLSSIDIPNSTIEIGEYAFYGIMTLGELSLGDELQKIGEFAFAELVNLSSDIILSSSLQSIGERAFYGNENMNISVPTNNSIMYIGAEAFAYTKEIEIVFSPYITTINNAFSNTSIAEVVIPSWITRIAEGAFDSSIIQSITFADESQLIEIAQRAFYNLQDTNFYLDNLPNLRNIGEYAFYNCTQLYSFIAPSLSIIGEGAFANCNAICELSVTGSPINYIFSNNVPSTLETIYVALGVTTIQESAFENITSIEAVYFSANTKYISSNAFKNAVNLQELRFELGITYGLQEIGKDAFYGTKWLQDYADGIVYLADIVYAYKGTSTENINIRAGTKTIGESAFSNANIKEVIIPPSVTKINDFAFAYCNNLNKVTFESGSTLTYVGEKAFFECIQLTAVILPLSVRDFGADILAGCGGMSSLQYNGRVSLGYLFGAQNYDNSYMAVQNDNSYYIPSGLTQIRILEGSASITEFAFQNCISIESVTIPISVNKISKFAFADCQNVNRILMMTGSQLTTIGDNAFINCVALNSLNLPLGAVNIGENILNGCNSITDITFNGELSLAKLFGSNNFDNSYQVNLDGENYYLPQSLETIIIAQNSTEINESGFANTKIKKIVIPASVLTIKPYAFFSATELVTVDFSGESSLETIQADAFNECISLESIVLGQNVQYIGDRAFYNCSALENITVTNESCQIGVDTFYNTPWADGMNGAMYYGNTLIGFSGAMSTNHILTLREGTTDIADYALKDKHLLQEVRMPATLKTIGKGAFKGCVNLSDILFLQGNNLQAIGDEAFSNTNLSSFDIATEVKYINEKTFYECDNLIAINFMPNSQLEYIGNYAFSGTKLRVIDIPTEVIVIGDYAFFGCEELESVAFSVNNKLETIGAKAFYNLVNMQFECDNFDNLVAIKDDALFNCQSLTKIIAPNIQQIELNSLLGCYSIVELTIPQDTRIFELFGYDEFFNPTTYDTVTYMGVDYAIPKALTTVYLSNAITEIKNSTFIDCVSIKEVYLTPNVTAIGEYAFINCQNLEKVIGGENIVYIGDYAFMDCFNLDSSQLSQEKIFVIGKKVKHIGTKAFMNCSNLEKIVVSDNSQLEYIGDYAFANLVNTVYEIALISKPLRVGDYAFQDNASLDKFVADSVIEIGSGAFNGCYSLTELSVTTREFVGKIFGNSTYNHSYAVEYQGIDYYIPQSLIKVHISSAMTFVCDNALKDFESVQVVSLSNVASIGRQSFKGNLSLAEINIPASVITIDDFAFENCIELASVNIYSQNTLVYIGEDAFKNTQWYQDLYDAASEDIIYIGKIAYKAKGTISGVLELKEDTIGIAPKAFRNQNDITQLYLPLSVSSLGESAFANCTRIEKISMSGYFELGKLFGSTSASNSYLVVQNAQQYYIPQSLQEIKIIEGSTKIVDEAFADCHSITKVDIALSVKNIGDRVFWGCRSIVEMTLPIRRVLGSYFGDSIYNNSYSAVQGGNEYFIPLSLQEINIIGNSIAPYALQGLREVLEINIPSEIEDIGSYAFAGCEKIDRIELYNARYIGDYAFGDCKELLSVGFPQDVVLGQGLLHGCYSLSSLEVKGNKSLHLLFGTSHFENSYQININNKAYYVPNTLYTVRILDTPVIADSLLQGFISVARLTLPNNVIRIGEKAFYGLELIEEINIPASLKEVRDYAFYNNKKAEFNFEDNRIEIVGKKAFGNCQALSEFVSPIITSIGQDAFSGCSNLERVSITNDKTIGWYFGKQMFKSAYSVWQGHAEYYVPNKLTHIEIYGGGTLADSVFANMIKLRSVKLFGEIAIPQSAFVGCTEIIELVGDNIIFIENDALMNLPWLGIYFQDYHNEIAYIGKVAYAYIGTVTVSSITLRADTTQIYKNALAGLNKITGVFIPATVTHISIETFIGCDLLANVYVDEDNLYYSSIDGLLYNKDGDVLLFTPPAHG